MNSLSLDQADLAACPEFPANASYSFLAQGGFIVYWLRSWLIAWMVMLPVVIFVAPAIRSVAHFLTRED